MLVGLFIMLIIVIIAIGPMIYNCLFGSWGDKSSKRKSKSQENDWRAKVDMTEINNPESAKRYKKGKED